MKDNNQQKTAILTIDGKSYEFPIIEGTENEKAIDITGLRNKTGYITLDPSFMNTGACKSDITFIDGEKGILRYRGIPIEELIEKCSFVETAYLLLHDKLPSPEEYKKFSQILNQSSLLHESMHHFFDNFPHHSHPMHILATMINALSTFYPHVDSESVEKDIFKSSAFLISVFRTISAFSYKNSVGEPIVYPRHDLPFCANFLNMMFDSPVKPYHIDPEFVAILNKLLIVHADHEQNCSTTAVRVIGSAQVNLYATISAGVSALSGPLHGGANQAVIEMLKNISRDGGNYQKYVDLAKDKKSGYKLMGFGHRVYKTFDPRAMILKKECHKILKKITLDDPLFEIALKLEEIALKDDYFVSRNLYPNVDFYSGIIYRAMGIPTNMFTVMFAIARLPGWIAQWREMISSPDKKIARPRQIYVGHPLRHVEK